MGTHACGTCGKTYTDEQLEALPEVGIQWTPQCDDLCNCGHPENHRTYCEARPYGIVLVNCTCDKPGTFVRDGKVYRDNQGRIER